MHWTSQHNTHSTLNRNAVSHINTFPHIYYSGLIQYISFRVIVIYHRLLILGTVHDDKYAHENCSFTYSTQNSLIRPDHSLILPMPLLRTSCEVWWPITPPQCNNTLNTHTYTHTHHRTATRLHVGSLTWCLGPSMLTWKQNQLMDMYSLPWYSIMSFEYAQE